ncbi:MAG: helix-hairpin-helix domain-containing protein [Oscillospiraceae bacterium]|nr:helix-hairpin-helix domain-containing protein [Oscillospiraceae bacterium]
MEHKEKFGGAHAALLLLTVAFLVSLAWLSLRGEAPVAAAGGYTVSVERSVPEEQRSVPKAEPVDVNTAAAEELESLPGIGPVLAQRIVDYRTAHGAFSAVEDLLEVEGIGSAKLEDIRGSITVGGGTP